MLREPEARDRAAVIELFASPEVGTYLGGPRPRDELERAVPEVPRRRPGLFVVDLDGAMIGTITLDRRDAERPGHVRPDAGEAELGYMFLPEAWGCGYATEACAAALDWFAGALPSEPVVLCTPDRQRPLDAPRREAGVHRGGAVRGVRRRAVVRRVVLGHAIRLSSCAKARRIHDETERFIARFTTGTPTDGPRLSVESTQSFGGLSQLCVESTQGARALGWARVRE